SLIVNNLSSRVILNTSRISERMLQNRSLPLMAFTFLSIVISLPSAALDRYSTLEKSSTIFCRRSAAAQLKSWFPHGWMLPSSRIFLSVNLATVTPFTSSMSMRRLPAAIVMLPLLKEQKDWTEHDHPPFPERCQAI